MIRSVTDAAKESNILNGERNTVAGKTVEQRLELLHELARNQLKTFDLMRDLANDLEVHHLRLLLRSHQTAAIAIDRVYQETLIGDG